MAENRLVPGADYSAFEDSSDAEDPLSEPREEVLEDEAPLVSTGRRRRTFANFMRNAKGLKRNSAVPDAFIENYKNAPHYMKEDSPEDLLARARFRILRGVESVHVRILATVVLLVCVVLVVVELAIGEDNFPVIVEEVFEIFALLFSAYFCGEVSLRIVGQGKLFFHRWFEVLDLLVIVVSTLLTIIYVIIDTHGEDREINVGILTSRLFIFGRVVRVFFWARIVYEQKSIQRYIRSKVSQNRRRYTAEGFDLDLTYVTDRVIAMSFPSSGSASFYRNSIQEVGQFLDKKHFGHYRVYNLCSESEYDTSYFHHQVQRILIDDHNVPKFTDLIDFCEDVFMWMDANEENVIVVHCKGGKGRTGTMIAAWLVRSGLFEQAAKSLAYFSDRRTDKSRGSKNQGVETPSQSRYVRYYEQLLTQMGGNLPPPTSLRIKELTIYGLTEVGSGDGLDWRFEVLLIRNKIFDCSLATPSEQVRVVNDSVQVVFSERRPLIVTDDVRLKFYCSTKTVPVGHDKCQFSLWFHTTFIENNKLYLDRSDLDNLQKSKNRRSYPVNFALELLFEPYFVSGAVFCTSDAHQLID